MNNSQPWHASGFGRVCCTLGSVKLAVPVMGVVIAAMVWGTLIESSQSAEIAKAMVYGSWWFIGLMVLVCVILVAAVLTRYPWKRKHTGFIVVHASLIMMIIGGFWSLMSRQEGQLMLTEGTSGHHIELPGEQIELLEHSDGQMVQLGAASIDQSMTSVEIDGTSVRIVGFWANTRQQQEVVNDDSNPFEAVEVTTDPAASKGVWIGQIPADQSWPRLGDIAVRVVPAGEVFDPAVIEPQTEPQYEFMHGTHRHAVPAIGEEAVEGWTVESIERFSHANVTPDGLAEAPDQRDNPAIQVMLRHESGALERHIAFEKFPDMQMRRTIEGEADSGASLVAPPASLGRRMVFETGEDGLLRVSEFAADGALTLHEQVGDLPWTIQLEGTPLTVLRHFDHAHAIAKTVEAPAAEQSRPAVVVQAEPGGPEVPLAWKGTTPVETANGVVMLRYGPETIELPFMVRLDDFRKLDYPGTAMAMAYESDVTVTLADGTVESSRIYMNNPFEHEGWKLYQSGFLGDNVSIFSVMKDPGLGATYLGCAGLCLGLVLTFYAGGLSWGHPGIPVAFGRKGQSNASKAVDSVGAPVGDGVHASPDLA